MSAAQGRRALKAVAVVLLVIGASQGRAEPARHTEFSAQNLDGQTVHFSQLRGRVSVVTFWATWCFPCLYEMPLLEKLYRRLGDRGLAVIAVATNDERSAVRAYQAERAFSFEMLYDPSGEVLHRFGASTVPATFIVDREGRLVAVEDPSTGERATLIDNPLTWERPEVGRLLESLLGDQATSP